MAGGANHHQRDDVIKRTPVTPRTNQNDVETMKYGIYL